MNIDIVDLHKRFVYLLTLPESSLQNKAVRCWLSVLAKYVGESDRQYSEDVMAENFFSDLYVKSKIAYDDKISGDSIELIANSVINFLGEVRDYVKKEIVKECQRLFVTKLASSNQRSKKSSNQSVPPVLIVGAGAAAIALSNELNARDISFHIVDSNDGPGGCWRAANYVGARTDVANLMYAFTFNFKYPWQEVYSTQPTMRSYLENCAAISFNDVDVKYSIKLLSADFVDEGYFLCTFLNLKNNTTFQKFFSNVVFACGQLSIPYYPNEIKGAVDTKYCTHTASGADVNINQLNHVAIIGSAASAVQLANGLSRKKIKVDIYSRSDSWFYNVPHYQQEFPESLKVLVDNLPFFAEIFRLVAHKDAIFGNLSKVELKSNGEPSQQLLDFKDELTANLIRMGLGSYIPDYLPGVKRILVDDGSFGKNVNSGNVTITKEEVKEISENSVLTYSGKAKQYDHIFLATGYVTDSFVGKACVTYKGVKLSDIWSKRPVAYCGIVVPEIPSVYIMYGPNTNGVVNGNIFWFLERQAEAIANSLEDELGGNRSRLNLEAKRNMSEYQKIVDFGNMKRSWGKSEKTGWYRHHSGFSVQNWPFSLAAYNLVLQDFDGFKQLKETNYG
jgi:4-hydroxyacetophenone monooxygenase